MDTMPPALPLLPAPPSTVRLRALVGTALLLLAPASSTAAELSARECEAVLASHAMDPKAVPRELVDRCRAPGDGPPRSVSSAKGSVRALASLEDPCTGPGAADSVFCWGPWGELAPAAGPTPGLALASAELDRPLPENCVEQGSCTVGVQLAEAPPLPLGACEPGLPCGFATVLDGVPSIGAVGATTLARAEVSDDGTAFTILAPGATPLSSVSLAPRYVDRADGFENLRAQGTEGDLRSRLVARVLRRADGTVLYAADVWGHGDAAAGTALSGMLAAGTAVSAADIETLTASGSGAVLRFAGPMSVDSATRGELVLRYGTAPEWTGSWTNPAFAFSAGGPVRGADFVSEAGRFSGNVQAGFVQGALLGPLEAPAAAHVIDVTLEGAGAVRDVGLLREAAP